MTPERAQALLANAGYGPSQKKLSLTLLSASKSNVAQRELALVAADLAAVGVELQIKYETDWPTFEADSQLQQAPDCIVTSGLPTFQIRTISSMYFADPTLGTTSCVTTTPKWIASSPRLWWKLILSNG